MTDDSGSEVPFRFEQTCSPRDPDFVAKVLEARRTSIGERILAGARLFDIRCEEAQQLIRTKFPEFNDEQVEEELGRWLKRERDEDEAGIYQDAGMLDE